MTEKSLFDYECMEKGQLPEVAERIGITSLGRPEEGK